MILVFLFPMSLMAQATEGSILGVVIDPAGNVIIGAKVTVTSITTNFARKTVTNGSGEYVVPNLPPGEYKVTTESSGFDTRTQSSVEMTIKARVRVDFSMQTGSVAQTVEVTSSAPLLKTDTSEVATLISREELDSLPSIDRNFLSMQVLVPGTLRHTTSMGSDRIGDFSGGESMQVNGINAGQNNFILDGISNNVVLTGGMNSVPPIDAIQEVAIQTNGYSAEFGRAGGGIVNVALRSGTNQIHGYAYDYIQNDLFNARPYNFTSTNLAKVPLRRNLFGVGGGGPIVRNKAFVFFSYEGLRQPASVRELDTTPTALERTGDFSQSGWTVYDPTTTNSSGNRSAFPGNVIRANRIDPLMKRLASFFPLPNFTPVGTSLNNYAAVDVNNDTHDTYNVKADINLTQRDLLSVRYSKQHSERDRSGWIPGGWIGGRGLLDGDNIGINETHTFTPNLLNEIRIGYNYINDGNTPLNTTQINELSEIPGGIAQPGFPAVSFQNIGSTKAVRPLATLPNPYIVWQNTLQVMENLSWHKGRHAIKVGVDFNLQRNSVGGGAPPGGMKFSVDGLATVSSTTAKKPSNITGTAEGLLGYVSTLTTYNYADKTRLYQSPWSAFIEDEWRVTNKLNITLGLRYELTPTWYSDGDLTTNFDLTAGKILVPNTTKAYVANVVGLPGAVLPSNYQYVDPSQVYAHPSTTDFAPRLGFAYSITPTFVFRGNYGVFYAPNAALGLNNQTGAPFSFQLQVIGDQADPVKMTDGFPTGGAAAELGSTDIAPVYYQPNFRTPIVQKFGSNLQWLPFKNTVAEIGYEGNRGTGFDEGYQLNFPTPGPGTINTRRPYPNLAEGTATVYEGDSNFNALEIVVRQRALHGLTFQSALTIQHAYGQNGITDPYHFGYTEGRLASDYGKQWVTGLTYNLPTARTLPYAARLFVGGWQASSIIQLHGGLPFSVASNNNMNDDLNAARADVNYEHGNPGSPDLGQRRSHLMWFNSDAFTNPADYTYGNSGINMLRGPGLQQFDLSLQKTFAITERYHATLRAEAENVFNHANLAPPSATVGNAGFNQITATAADMRTMQMVFRVAF
jgi:hypothetical protein